LPSNTRRTLALLTNFNKLTKFRKLDLVKRLVNRFPDSVPDNLPYRIP